MQSYKIIRTDKAEEDLKDIALYIAIDNSVEVAYKIVDEFEQAIERLKDMPYSGSPNKFRYTKKHGYRFLVVKKYLVHYHVDEKEKIVYIDRIKHGAMNPKNQI